MFFLKIYPSMRRDAAAGFVDKRHLGVIRGEWVEDHLPALAAPYFDDVDEHILVFLVTGESKREALDAIRRGEDLPAGRVRPTEGDVIWIVDRAAAGDE